MCWSGTRFTAHREKISAEKKLSGKSININILFPPCIVEFAQHKIGSTTQNTGTPWTSHSCIMVFKSVLPWERLGKYATYNIAFPPFKGESHQEKNSEALEVIAGSSPSHGCKCTPDSGSKGLAIWSPLFFLLDIQVHLLNPHPRVGSCSCLEGRFHKFCSAASNHLISHWNIM